MWSLYTIYDALLFLRFITIMVIHDKRVFSSPKGRAAQQAVTKTNNTKIGLSPMVLINHVLISLVEYVTVQHGDMVYVEYLWCWYNRCYLIVALTHIPLEGFVRRPKNAVFAMAMEAVRQMSNFFVISIATADGLASKCKHGHGDVITRKCFPCCCPLWGEST